MIKSIWPIGTLPDPTHEIIRAGLGSNDSTRNGFRSSSGIMHTRPAYMQVYLNTLNIYKYIYLTLPNSNTLSHSLNLSYLSHHPLLIIVTLTNPHSYTPSLTASSPLPSITLTLTPPCVFTSPSTPTPPLSPTHRNSLSMIWIRSPPFFFFFLVLLPFLFLNDMFVLFFFFFFLLWFLCLC